MLILNKSFIPTHIPSLSEGQLMRKAEKAAKQTPRWKVMRATEDRIIIHVCELT